MSAEQLAEAVKFSVDWLGVYVEEVNALNVYPVPDGDTGTNMHLTMQAVRRQLDEAKSDKMDTVARSLSYGSLLGARGNSGVILSQILKGFADSIRGLPRLQAADLAEALTAGSEAAYAAVMKPVEGTILTVVREAAEAAEASAVRDLDQAEGRASAAGRGSGTNTASAQTPLELLNVAHSAGEESLANTPELLPILKQAGVVDAGGLGFLRILEGIIAYLEGRALPPPPKVTKRAQQQFEEAEFGFCTEFLLADVKVPTEQIRDLVAPYGDSLLVVGAEGFVKGHIHTEEPEKLLSEVARFGRMVRSKVEDMTEQHSEILADVDPKHAEAPKSAAVAVASGYGLTRVLRSLGVRVVGGGQTDNPSVQDIADAVRSVGAHDVIVMPNNKNIIMAAERVAELVPGKNVLVLPTRTLGQGLAAAVLFQENQDASELFEAMSGAAKHSLTIEITRAQRAVTLNGVAVRKGDAIGLANGELKAAARSYADCVMKILEEQGDDYEVASLFYASEVGEKGATALRARIETAYPELELEVHPGAPDLYAYLMVLE